MRSFDPRSWLGKESESVSRLSARTPFNGRFAEVEFLDHERSRFVEIFDRCAGPIACGASAGVAFAAQRDPFSSAQYVANTDRLLGIRWIDGATLV